MEMPQSSSSEGMTSLTSEGLMRLLNFNNELVTNLVHLMKKDKERNGVNGEQIKGLSLSQNSITGIKRPNDFNRASSANTTNFGSVSEVHYSKRAKSLESNILVAPQVQSQSRALKPPSPAKPSSAFINPMTVLQNQIVAQNEEITMLKRKIGSMRNVLCEKKLATNDISNHNHKHPQAIEWMLQEVIHLNSTFMKLIDDFCRTDREGANGIVDENLLRFRAEVNGIYEQAHKKLSCWRKNQYEMYEELKMTKQLLFDSLREIVSKSPSRQNQAQSFAPFLSKLPNMDQNSQSFPSGSFSLSAAQHLPMTMTTHNRGPGPYVMPQKDQQAAQLTPLPTPVLSSSPTHYMHQNNTPKWSTRQPFPVPVSTGFQQSMAARVGQPRTQNLPVSAESSTSQLLKGESESARDSPTVMFAKTSPNSQKITTTPPTQTQACNATTPDCVEETTAFGFQNKLLSEIKTPKTENDQSNAGAKAKAESSLNDAVILHGTQDEKQPPENNHSFLLPSHEAVSIASPEDLRSIICEMCGDLFSTLFQLGTHMNANQYVSS